ncbi:cysteine sulfinic acid decarboxylase-like isoform X1 [Limulus polyphemus]|uniref:Cysteine sulfinic acid decarboxylase-like isoform X1 n=1 Tax=Limulus polyphemus TaxID=6850 RepID=A0ABM1BUM6_LIMPO|nr:cysteine sulfinic acid decarboxylase-like isoform X1 [Limulus polyphemus]
MEDIEFLERVVKRVMSSGILGNPKDLRNHSKVTEFVDPEDLKRKLDLEILDEPASNEELLGLCEDVMRYSVKTGHPMFLNQLYHGLDGYCVAGAWLTDVLNTSQSTYEISPVFTVMETFVIRHIINNFIGWDDGEGIFSPGGSVANMYAMFVARHKALPDVKTKGLRGFPQLVAFVSEDGHYSTTKTANWLGIGTDNLVIIKVDDRGRMVPEDLDRSCKEAKQQGKLPFYVCATAGSTVLGSFDPLHQIADICQKHDLWFHVDAAWGGTVLLSRSHRHLMDGVNRADSVTWDFHKMPGLSLYCSVFLTKWTGMLYECNSSCAEYLFQEDKHYDGAYDTGEKSVQCGRKVDVLKLYLAWRGRGQIGMEQLVNHAFNMAQYFFEKIKHTKGFKLVLPEFQFTNICFWYVPPSLQGKEHTPDFWDQLSTIAPKLKEKMTKQGTMMIAYQPLSSKSFPNFFRLIVHCLPSLSKEDMDFIVTELQRLAEDL